MRNRLPQHNASLINFIGQINTVAEASGISFEQAEQHPDSHNKLRVEYGVVFPVQGEYAQIRYFVARVLADPPAIALDQFNFQRDKLSEPRSGLRCFCAKGSAPQPIVSVCPVFITFHRLRFYITCNLVKLSIDKLQAGSKRKQHDEHRVGQGKARDKKAVAT